MNRLQELLARWRTGELSDAELPELTRLLRAPGGREAVRAEFEFDALLHETVRGQAIYERVAEEFDARYPQVAPRVEPVRWHWWEWAQAWRARLAWAAAAAAIAIAAYLAGGMRERPIAVETLLIVEEIHGAVTWSAADGRARSDLRTGDRLGAGQLETLDADSSVRVRFADGTTCALGSGGFVALADAGQKVVQLKAGALGVNAAPQPAGRPMRLRTPTAEIEVVGTVFAASARDGRTSLSVDEGRVRMRRLADGREVEVPAAQVALATLDRTAQFAPRPRPAPVRQWGAAFDTTPDSMWSGEWRPGSLATRPYVALRPPRTRELMIRHGVRAELTSALDQPRVLITAGSVLTVRWRTARRADWQVFFGTEHPNGRFGGNYQMKLPAPPRGADPTAWQESRVRLGECAPTQHNVLATSPLRLQFIILSTAFAADGLEIAEVRIADAATR